MVKINPLPGMDVLVTARKNQLRLYINLYLSSAISAQFLFVIGSEPVSWCVSSCLFNLHEICQNLIVLHVHVTMYHSEYFADLVVMDDTLMEDHKFVNWTRTTNTSVTRQQIFKVIHTHRYFIIKWLRTHSTVWHSFTRLIFL